MDMLAQAGVRVVHNPESNLKLASGISPVTELVARHMPVGLGTDGCASNNNLDLFGEMDTAAKLAKVITLDPTVLNAQTVLRMATIEGARVLGMKNQIGSLEIGKQADVIVIDTHKPHLTPLYNPYSQMVYAATGQDVRHVIIDGRMVMEDRRLLTLDMTEVLARAGEKAALVREWVI
jgi:5-methylthioadenosine/S-adenosylhomocysteine deaminase